MRTRAFATAATALHLLLCGTVGGSAGGLSPPAAAAAGWIEPAPEAAPEPGPTIGVAEGSRAALEARGVRLGATYLADALGNPNGGLKQGASFEGLLSLRAGVDLGTLLGLRGTTLHAEGLLSHGRSLTGNNTRDLFTASSIDALAAGRLYEAWIEQKLYGDKLFVRLGQLGADSEFFISRAASLFVDSTFGFPAIFANDLPSGGPAYPLATPGALAKIAPGGGLALLAAVFDGNPAGPYRPGVNAFLPERRDPSGLNLRLRDGPLLWVEGQQSYRLGGLPGTIKLGYAHLFGAYTVALVPIGGALTGQNGNGFGYAVLDQAIYRAPGADDRGVSAFLRVAAAPSDRNLVDRYVDAGIVFKGLVPGRPDDSFGVSGAYARIAPALGALDVAAGLAPLVRDESGVIEVTYQSALRPGVTLQPDLQYLFHPGAHAVAIPGTAVPLHDALVLGLRLIARF